MVLAEALMAIRPIMLNAFEVRAIIAGRKKRVQKVVAVPKSELKEGQVGGVGSWLHGDVWALDLHGKTEQERLQLKCPYGQPGDSLWVKEDWCSQRDNQCERITYAADGMTAFADEIPDSWKRPAKGVIVPARRMPRWASRLMLEIVGIQLMPMGWITRQDAAAEGMFARMVHNGKMRWRPEPEDPRQYMTAQECFVNLWEANNGEGSWGFNTSVWAITFVRDGV